MRTRGMWTRTLGSDIPASIITAAILTYFVLDYLKMV